MKIRKVPNGLRVDGVLITRNHENYVLLLQIWERRSKSRANKRLQAHREKKILNEPNRMRHMNQPIHKMAPSTVKTRKTMEGTTVYDPVRRMWVVFTNAEKEQSFWERLALREEGKLGL